MVKFRNPWGEGGKYHIENIEDTLKGWKEESELEGMAGAGTTTFFVVFRSRSNFDESLDETINLTRGQIRLLAELRNLLSRAGTDVTTLKIIGTSTSAYLKSMQPARDEIVLAIREANLRSSLIATYIDPTFTFYPTTNEVDSVISDLDSGIPADEVEADIRNKGYLNFQADDSVKVSLLFNESMSNKLSKKIKKIALSLSTERPY
ncbi:MAG: hypothetical protein MUC87_11330 [Bacteroidia bacterium]|nr:hypothetical protein [Bacteroidia bacterium]